MADCVHFLTHSPSGSPARSLRSVQASPAANTYVISGNAETKPLQDLMPGIITQLGAEGMANLQKVAARFGGSTAGGGGDAAGDDDDVPELVQNFDDGTTAPPPPGVLRPCVCNSPLPPPALYRPARHRFRGGLCFPPPSTTRRPATRRTPPRHPATPVAEK